MDDSGITCLLTSDFGRGKLEALFMKTAIGRDHDKTITGIMIRSGMNDQYSALVILQPPNVGSFGECDDESLGKEAMAYVPDSSGLKTLDQFALV